MHIYNIIQSELFIQNNIFGISMLNQYLQVAEAQTKRFMDKKVYQQIVKQSLNTIPISVIHTMSS